MEGRVNINVRSSHSAENCFDFLKMLSAVIRAEAFCDHVVIQVVIIHFVEVQPVNVRHVVPIRF